GRSNEFADRVYPVLTRDRLQGKRVAIVALGGLPSEVSGAVEEALGPTGARLVGVGVVREPVDVNGLAGDLSQTRFFDLRTNPEALTALGSGLGRQLVIGGTLPEVVRGHLFSRASGSFGALDGVIVVRNQPQDMGPAQRSTASQLESALLGGMAARRTPVVGVETSSTEPSSVSFFQSNALSSVDDVELTAGKLAMVFAMLGAEGSFGIKSSADRLLPDLLTQGG
ncbi:MAG TPA: copper transporter, partial [Solirubrobacterales bacterium]|nr:copper transporter [Solirubrobacterales bacterium]